MDLKKHIQCAIAFAQVKRKYLIMFVFSFFLQILAWKKEKKWGFFFDDMISPYDNAHIYFFPQKILNPNILSSLTSGNIILIFWGKQRAPGQTRT